MEASGLGQRRGGQAESGGMSGGALQLLMGFNEFDLYN